LFSLLAQKGELVYGGVVFLVHCLSPVTRGPVRESQKSSGKGQISANHFSKPGNRSNLFSNWPIAFRINHAGETGFLNNINDRVNAAVGHIVGKMCWFSRKWNCEIMKYATK
jgi:hypothetical protein